MGLGKTFRKTVKSTKDLATTYQVCKKICEDGKLKMKQDEVNADNFTIHAAEPMKWITTNWPNSILLKGEIFEGKVLVNLEAESKGTSITQDKNISDFLNNVADSLETYVS
jgi:hypothetical protein